MGLRDLTDRARQTPNYFRERRYKNGHPLIAIEGRFVDLVWECDGCQERSTHLSDFDKIECNPTP